MTDKTIVLVTGGNTGLGYETVKALYAGPEAYTILMGSRSLEKADNAIKQLKSEVSESKSEVVPLQVDIESDDSVESAFQEVKSKYGRVDSLVNNAGATHEPPMLKDPSKANIRKAWNATYNVNTTSTQVMTWTFIPLLLESKNPRLIFVTSGIASLTFSASGRSSVVSKQPPKGWPKPTDFSGVAYRASKAGLNLLMIDWTRVLKEDGVKVFGIAPGMLATGFAGMGADAMRKIGAMEPNIGGEFIRDVVAGKRDEDAGKVINKDGITAW